MDTQESKNKVCQNCKAEFAIEPEDFEFYKKIDVPEPTFCPDCRAQRRFLWRNEGKLYSRRCDFSGKETFSCYSEDAPVKVYETSLWWSDEFEATEFGREYDFSRPFFEQVAELFSETPLPSRSIINLVNSDYCMNAGDLKNCYLVFNAGKSENCSYGVNVDEARDSVDNFFLAQCELCYQCVMLTNCYKTFFSSHCDDCQEIWFCKNCKNCTNCFGCVNLRHKQYHIFNQEYSKEDYFEKLKEFNVGSHANMEEILRSTKEFWLKNPVRFMHGRKNNNVTGEYIFNSKNVKESYIVDNGEDMKFSQFSRFAPGAKDCYDYSGIGRNSELCYEDLIVGRSASRVNFCVNCYENTRNLDYCLQCVSSSNLFGCISLYKKEYCILNKQYTKEEYEELVPRIKQHMNDMPYVDPKEIEYKYGEFFPPNLSPFGYNETIAQEYFPLTKEQAIKKGYKWYDKPESEYQPTIKTDDLPDHIDDADESVLKEAIECGNSSAGSCKGSGVFRMIPSELKFYKKHNLPLPRLCPDCRHTERIKQRNPMKLHKRQCMCGGQKDETGAYTNQADHGHEGKRCENTFETTYAPDRKEIIYCKECYQKEVE